MCVCVRVYFKVQWISKIQVCRMKISAKQYLAIVNQLGISLVILLHL